MAHINCSHRWLRIASAALGLTLLSGLPAEARKKEKPQAEPAAGSGIPTAPVSAIAGPKRTVAVADFNAITNFLEQYGEVDVGGGLAAMLASALVESGQFIVVERAGLGAVLSEQELAATGTVSPEQDAPAGRLTGAQLLIMGSVTELSQAARGKSFGLGLGGIGLSPRSQTGTVGMDIRVIDTVTSEVVSSYLVRESVKSRSVDLSFTDGEIDLSHSNFHETPLGQAARKAIDAAVRRFAEEAAGRRWTGQVVDFDEGVVAINAGASSGIRAGDSFDLLRVTKVLRDPATGRVIGRRQQALGTVVIADVDESVAFGSFQGEAVAPQRGDIVAQRGDIVAQRGDTVAQR